MTVYPALADNSCVAHPSQIAFRNKSHALTYAELKQRCDSLQRQWAPQTPQRVGVWVDQSVNTFVAIHTLNQMGITVVCLRPCDPAQTASLCDSAQIDHEIQPNTLALKPYGEAQTGQPSNRSTGWSWDDTQFEIQSSGTTGTPKWLPLTTRQLVLSAFGSAIRLGHLPGDQWLNVLAPGHMGWLAAIARCALYGTTVHCRSFDAPAVIEVLNTKDITQVSLVPSMLRALLDSAPETLVHVRTILVGGGPTPSDLLHRCQALGIHVHTSWGMTEAASQIATRLIGDTDLDSHVGPPMPFADITIQKGLLHVDGPLMNAPLLTQDMGRIDADGRVTVFGRADDVILTSGHKVHPAAVESHFAGIEGLARCCAVGLPNETWGEVVVLTVEMGDQTNEAAVLGAVIERIREMSAPKRPRRLFVVNALPINEMSKVRRNLLLDGLLQFDQIMVAKPVHKHSGEGHGLEGLKVDGSMGQSDAGSSPTTGIDNVMSEGHRTRPQSNDANFNRQIFALSNGYFEVTLSINERQTDRMFVKELIPVAEDRKQELFESDVRIFEDTTEKNDARAVNLVESGFKVVTKSHEVNLLSRKEKVKI